MSTVAGTSLPAPVMNILAPERRARPEGDCLLLVTVDPDGQARPCLLSIGEMLAVDERRLRALVWPDSTTAANLERGSATLFVFAAPPDVFHVRARPRRLPPAPGTSLARFEFDVTSVEVDGHDGMPVTQPMRFAARAGYRDEVLDMWRHQLDALGH